MHTYWLHSQLRLRDRGANHPGGAAALGLGIGTARQPKRTHGTLRLAAIGWFMCCSDPSVSHLFDIRLSISFHTTPPFRDRSRADPKALSGRRRIIHPDRIAMPFSSRFFPRSSWVSAGGGKKYYILAVIVVSSLRQPNFT